MTTADIAIIGAGAAGLMAAIWAGRSNPNRKIVLLDGAKKIGRKILIAGGGRCNVTHHIVSEKAYAGGSRNAIKKVIKRFDVPETVSFFEALGVKLKREETGKLFPTTDKAQTVLTALLREASRYATLQHPFRIETISRVEERFQLAGPQGQITAEQLILATGGKSIPKTGSDGHGYRLAEGLGHSLTDYIFPALVPLTVPKQFFSRELSGLTLDTALELWSPTGKALQRFQNSTLCTHFGFSGPSVLDMSRYYLAERRNEPGTQLTINWTPGWESDKLANILKNERKKEPISILKEAMPERLAKALLDEWEKDPAVTSEIRHLPCNQLPKKARQALVKQVTRMPLPIAGDRGFDFAEVTAGGVPLTEIYLNTMASRITPNLYFCGEILDVDGCIGGFNFQWAWSSGYIAGVSV